MRFQNYSEKGLFISLGGKTKQCTKRLFYQNIHNDQGPFCSIRICGSFPFLILLNSITNAALSLILILKVVSREAILLLALRGQRSNLMLIMIQLRLSIKNKPVFWILEVDFSVHKKILKQEVRVHSFKATQSVTIQIDGSWTLKRIIQISFFKASNRRHRLQYLSNKFTY